MEAEIKMIRTIDARGLACPQPVVLAKKAMETDAALCVLVDNDMAVENIRRLAAKTGCRFRAEPRGGGVQAVTLERTGSAPDAEKQPAGEVLCAPQVGSSTDPLVVVLSDNRMGRGDDTLGELLARSFVHTLLQLDPLPTTILCYNAGVKLVLRGAPTLEDLQALEERGVDILVCGTCLNFFGLTDQVAAGHVSNMYDIAETLARAGRLVRP